MSTTKPSLFLPTLLMLIGVSVLCYLGTWQLQRLEWKQGLIQAIETQYEKDASKNPLTLDTPPLTRGIIRGKYDHESTFLIGPRTNEGKPGYHVITPLVMNNNKAAGVLINRGWVPLEFKNKLNDLKPPTGKTTITGLLRQPPQTNMFTPANNLESGAWYSINFEELSEHKGLNNIWPLMVYDEGAENKTDYPIAQATRPRLKNDHLQYAVFWFSMAGILMIIYGLRFLKRA